MDLEAKVRSDTSSASADIAKFGKGMESAGRSMTTGVTLPLIGAGAAIWAVGSNFEESLNQIVGLTDVTRDEIGGVRDAVLELAGETGRAPQELAEAFYFVASAGFEAEGAMLVLETSARASAAGLGTTQDIAKVLGSVLNAYGQENISAARAADILTEAISQGTPEASEWAAVLGRVVPTAASLGVQFDEVTASMSAMTLSGLGADEAATSLNQVLVSLLDPTNEAEEAMLGLGLSGEGLRRQLKEDGLLSTLRTLEEAFGNNEQAASLVFGNIRALRGVTSLLTLDSDQLSSVFDKVTDSQGRLAEGYSETEGASRDAARTSGDFQSLLIELSGAVLPLVVDAMRGVRDVLSDLRDAWGNLTPEMQTMIVKGAGIAAAIGPVLLVVGKLISLFGLLLSPIGLVVAAAAGLFLAWQNNFLGIRDIVMPVLEGLGAMFGTVVTSVQGFIAGLGGLGPVVQGVQDRLAGLGAVFQTVFTTIIQPAIQTVSALIDSAFRTVIGPAIQWFTTTVAPVLMQWATSVVEWFGANWPLISGAFNTVLTVAKFMVEGIIQLLGFLLSAVQDIWPAIQVVIETVVGVIGGIIKTFLAVLAGDWGAAWDGIKSVFTSIWTGMVKFLGTIPGLILGILKFLAVAALSWLGGLAGGLLRGAGTMVSSLVGVIRRLVPEWMAAIAALPARLVGFLGNLARQAFTAVGSLVSRLVTNVGTLPGKFITAIAGLPARLISFFGGMVSRVIGSLLRAGRGIVEGLWQGISNAVSWITGKISGFISGIVGNVLDFLGIGSPSKVFAEIGKNMMLGMGVGIERAEGGVAHTMDQAIAGLIPNSGLALAGRLGTTGPTTAVGGGSGEGNTTVVLYADRYMGTMEESRYYADMIARQIRFQKA